MGIILLTFMFEIIKILKLDQLSHTKNIILYSLLSSLVLYIKEYYDKGIVNIITLGIMLIYLADKKIGGRLFNFFAFGFTLIIFFAIFFQL